MVSKSFAALEEEGVHLLPNESFVDEARDELLEKVVVRLARALFPCSEPSVTSSRAFVRFRNACLREGSILEAKARRVRTVHVARIVEHTFL